MAERFYTKIVGTYILEDDFPRPVSTVRDVVVDPATGNLIAFVINASQNLVLSPMDVLSWSDVIRIHDRDNFVPGSEIMRVENVQKLGTRIFGNKVYTSEGIYLGMVVDFTIDAATLHLNKLFTAKVILGLIKHDPRIIAAKNIVEILPEKIVVNEDNKVTEKEKAVVEDLAVS